MSDELARGAARTGTLRMTKAARKRFGGRAGWFDVHGVAQCSCNDKTTEWCPRSISRTRTIAPSTASRTVEARTESNRHRFDRLHGCTLLLVNGPSYAAISPHLPTKAVPLSESRDRQAQLLGIEMAHVVEVLQHPRGTYIRQNRCDCVRPSWHAYRLTPDEDVRERKEHRSNDTDAKVRRYDVGIVCRRDLIRDRWEYYGEDLGEQSGKSCCGDEVVCAAERHGHCLIWA